MITRIAPWRAPASPIAPAGALRLVDQNGRRRVAGRVKPPRPLGPRGRLPPITQVLKSNVRLGSVIPLRRDAARLVSAAGGRTHQRSREAVRRERYHRPASVLTSANRVGVPFGVTSEALGLRLARSLPE